MFRALTRQTPRSLPKFNPIRARPFHQLESSRSTGWSMWLVGATALAVGGSLLYNSEKQTASAAQEKYGLDPKEFRDLTLKEKTTLTHDTSLYRLAFPTDDDILDMPVASYVLLSAKVPGEEKPVVRPYTPVSYKDKGHVDLVIKHYKDGKLTSYLEGLKPGDKIAIKGPMKKLPIDPNMKKRIGMIAGGTGLTPMYQVIQKIMDDPSETTEVTFLFANNTEDDIILKKELDTLAKKHKNFKVVYVVAKPSSSWKGETGFVTADIAKKYLPKPADENLILVCGPPPMVKAIAGSKTPKFEQGELQGVLKELGYNEKQVFKF